MQPALVFVALPDTVSDEAAATLLFKGMTAQYLLRKTHAVQAGEVLLVHSAAGGVGQIALHGTNAPGLMGQAASNGCVRLENSIFLEVQKLSPLGTPVQIVP